MQRRKYDVVTFPRQLAGDDARAAWPDAPAVVRYEIVRSVQELSRGIAIGKDRMLGRPKNCADGFHGLEIAETKLNSLESSGETGAVLKNAQERVDKLKDELRADEAEIARRQESLDAARVFGDHFGLQDTAAIAGKIQEFVNIESALRSDPIGGIFMICHLLGADPLELLAHASHRSQVH